MLNVALILYMAVLQSRPNNECHYLLFHSSLLRCSQCLAPYTFLEKNYRIHRTTHDNHAHNLVDSSTAYVLELSKHSISTRALLINTLRVKHRTLRHIFCEYFDRILFERKMGRKIPARKHMGVRDPIKQNEERLKL